jgi:hypothetical protein
MIVDRNEVNLGKMSFGETKSFNVVVRNNYPEKVKINAVTKSCTCTTASLEGLSELFPGQQSLLVVTITPGSTGPFSRQANVHFVREGIGEFTDTVLIKAMVE